MANEVTINTMIQLDNGNLSVPPLAVVYQQDQATKGKASNVQDIGFSAHEILSIPAEISTAGYAFFRNLDATNFVEIGIDYNPSTFAPLIKLKPGAVALLPLAITAVYAKANTAAVKLEWLILSD